MSTIFRSYCSTDFQACTDIFDANCPEFFAPNERQEYEEFLKDVSQAYDVCEVDGQVLGAFGLFDDGTNEKRLNWILLDPQSQGIGIGLKIMERVLHLGRKTRTKSVNIAASQKSAPFFAKFGATITTITENGWGPGMHRVDMVLPI